jgi:hypothetical protein
MVIGMMMVVYSREFNLGAGWARSRDHETFPLPLAGRGRGGV